MNAQGLEGAGGGMNGMAQRRRALRLGHDFHQLRSGGERATGDDGGGDAPSILLFAQPGDHRGQGAVIGAVEEVGGGGAFKTHAQVQRAFLAKGKSTRGRVELKRRYAQIQHNAVAGTGQHVHAGEFAFHQSQAALETLHQRLAARDGFGIAINAGHVAIGGFQYRLAVAAAAESAVNVMGAVFRRQTPRSLPRA